MAIDFQNYTIWATAGDITQPPFASTGWACGEVDNQHMNWWFNRADTAIVELDGRVSVNEANISALTTQINNIDFQVDRSGLLGHYVFDSSSLLSVGGNAVSPGISSEVVVKSATHVIQGEGDIHVEVGFESNVAMYPYQGKSCAVICRYFVNDTLALSGTYGEMSVGSSGSATLFFGLQSSFRFLQGNYNWNYPGIVAPPVKYSQGDVLNLEFRAYINSTFSGAAGFGALKLVVKEYRAVDV